MPIAPSAQSRVGNATGRTDGCNAIRTLTPRRSLAEWAAAGVRAIGGDPLPRARIPASLVLTADARRFLAYRSHEALLSYNCSHRYALGVALLADEIDSRARPRP